MKCTIFAGRTPVTKDELSSRRIAHAREMTRAAFELLRKSGMSNSRAEQQLFFWMEEWTRASDELKLRHG
jgi:hypothetical protein